MIAVIELNTDSGEFHADLVGGDDDVDHEALTPEWFRAAAAPGLRFQAARGSGAFVLAVA